MANITVNMDGNAIWNNEVGLVATDLVKLGESVQTRNTLKIGSSNPDAFDPVKGGFCNGSVYKLTSKLKAASDSYHAQESTAIGPSNPYIPGWQLKSVTDNYEKVAEKIDNLYVVGSSEYDKLTEIYVKTSNKHYPGLPTVENPPYAHYFDKNHKYNKHELSYLNRTRDKGKPMLYLDPKMPYLLKETKADGTKIYRIYGDHDPNFIPGHRKFTVSGAKDVVELHVREIDGSVVKFDAKYMERAEVVEYVKQKVDLFVMTIKNQQKLTWLILYHGDTFTTTSEYTEIRSEWNQLFKDVVEYANGRWAAANAEKQWQTLVNNAYQAASEYCSDESVEVTYKGPGKASIPRYTGLLQVSVMPHISKLVEHLHNEAGENGANQDFVDRTMQPWMQIQNPQQFFIFHMGNQGAIKASPGSSITEYIETTCFSGDVDFILDPTPVGLRIVNTTPPNLSPVEGRIATVATRKYEIYKLIKAMGDVKFASDGTKFQTASSAYAKMKRDTIAILKENKPSILTSGNFIDEVGKNTSSKSFKSNGGKKVSNLDIKLTKSWCAKLGTNRTKKTAGFVQGAANVANAVGNGLEWVGGGIASGWKDVSRFVSNTIDVFSKEPCYNLKNARP